MGFAIALPILRDKSEILSQSLYEAQQSKPINWAMKWLFSKQMAK
jgi:hypothetical protein